MKDGSILVYGWFSSFSGHNVNDVARLNEDGAVDTNFALNFGNIFQNSIGSVLADSEGRLLVGGNFRMLQGVAVTNLARLSAEGLVDTSYQAVITNSVAVRHIYEDDKVLLEVFGTAPGGISTTEFVRLNADGSRDGTFSHGTEYRAVAAVDVLPDGAVVAAFRNNNFSSSLTMLQADGSVNPVFAPPGLEGMVYSISHQSSGKIIVGGIGYGTGPLERGVIRLGPHGAEDKYYPSGRGAGSVMTTLVLPDDRILFGGAFTNVDSAAHNRIAAFLAESPAPKAEIVYQNGGDSLAMYWNAARNGIYELQVTDAPDMASWRSLTREAGIGYNQQLIVPIQSSSNELFRLRVEVLP
ncbi:MAG TPA: delta-60 repeat domain-containing protein [Verrucomicrobiae bacterium]